MLRHFVLGGAILCSMAAFKAHVAFGFWQNRRVTGEQAPEKDAMGQFGRIAYWFQDTFPVLQSFG